MWHFRYLTCFGSSPVGRVMKKITPLIMPPEKISFPKEEEVIMKYWKDVDAFKQQLRKTQHLPPFTFYDGPPFATGTPHYGHIAAGTIKDVVCRYASQTGHYVQRRFGWDCHGLPIEYQIDKQLKITNKKQTLDMGIGNYNNACRNIVMRYAGQWQTVVGRFGRWIDFKNDYKTMDTNFMQSVWYVFQQLFKRGLVYRSRKIMPYSNACSTVLSNFQVQQNYKEIDDPSIYVTFPLVSDPEVQLVAWTTTPWTLPSNLTLAVHPQFNYVKVKDLKKNKMLIIGETRLNHYFGKEQYEVIYKMKGTQLQGLQYKPLYDFFIDRTSSGCFKVIIAPFVTDSDGTGIVHCAPGFGQQDFNICVLKGLITADNPPVPLDDNGRFTSQIPQFQGKYIKQADTLIIKDLKQRKRLLKHGTIKHNYPFCWRSQTPLIYKAVTSWFIKVTSIKDDLVKNNQKAYWIPKNIQEKKFDNWLRDARDWCFSRNRFWGNPIPLWVSDDGQEVICVGSLKQLQELTGVRVTDLHRQNIDHLQIDSRMGKGKLKRIQEVFDCWFQSGSMPFAQVHYPFTTSQEQFSKIFPADFIGEGIDQTRGWFYTLNVIATGVKNLNPYKNLIVNGLVLNQDGKKMSKRLKNYPDPLEVCSQFGADAIRLYLINSPLVRADNLNFSKDGVRGVIKDVFLPWYNVYRFLIQHISAYEQQSGNQFIYEPISQNFKSQLNSNDKWIISSLQILIKNVRKQMGQYKLYNVVPKLLSFLEQLTNWYVRLNRLRMKGEHGLQESYISLQVLLDVLHKVNVLMSPYVPFLTEHMYQNMKLAFKEGSSIRQSSIHHLMIPEADQNYLSEAITEQMAKVTNIIETARKLREIRQISLKNPINSLTIINKNKAIIQEIQPFLVYIHSEINVETITIETDTEKYIKLQILPNLPVLGPKFKGNKYFSNIRRKITQLTSEQITKTQQTGQIVIQDHIISIEELIITQKFISKNIKEYETIGGDKVIVLLDTRQSQELKIKGVAREIISRVQKLKKKASIAGGDNIVVLCEINQQSTFLKKVVQIEQQNIAKAIKKPFLTSTLSQGELLIQQLGTILEEPFNLKLILQQTEIK